jgi:hypothetical protein
VRGLAAALALGTLVLTTGAPAAATLVEVTTSVAVADAADQEALARALRAAVDGLLQEAIAFTPALVVLTRATVVGGRLYVRLLVADAEGARALDATGAPPPAGHRL